MSAITLCVPPRPGEFCAAVRLDLTEEHTIIELTSRHRITKVEADEVRGVTMIWVDITDPEASRPVHVRFSVLPAGTDLDARPEITSRSREPRQDSASGPVALLGGCAARAAPPVLTGPAQPVQSADVIFSKWSCSAGYRRRAHSGALPSQAW